LSCVESYLLIFLQINHIISQFFKQIKKEEDYLFIQICKFDRIFCKFIFSKTFFHISAYVFFMWMFVCSFYLAYFILLSLEPIF